MDKEDVVCVYMYMYIYVYMYVCVHIYVCVCVYIYTHTYTSCIHSSISGHLHCFHVLAFVSNTAIFA